MKSQSAGEIIVQIASLLLPKYGGQPIIQENIKSQGHLKYPCLHI